MRKSAALAAAFDRLGLLKAALAARRRGWSSPVGVTVLLYHRVIEPAAIGDLDPDLVDATPQEFDRQMDYVRRNFRSLGVDDVLAAYRAGRELPPDSVLVTFDDGYRDNHDHALPILLRHGVKALFFVTTGNVNDRRLFWWERIRVLVARSQRATARIEYPHLEDFDLSSPAAKARSVHRLNNLVKRHVLMDLERFLSGLAAACGVTWTETDEREHAQRTVMTWEQIKALHASGMGIGSHTCSHRVLHTLDSAALATELGESRAILERRTGVPVTTVAYPVGRSVADSPLVRRAVADAGYELGFTTMPGPNPLAASDPLDIKRLPIDRRTPAALTRTWMAFPLLAQRSRRHPPRTER